MELWSQQAWQAALPVYEQIIEHPYIRTLAAGTLARHKFLSYLRQDSLYLASYTQVLLHIAQRLQNPQHKAAFEMFAHAGMKVEKSLHEVFLQGDIPALRQIEPACKAYCELQQSQAEAPVELEVVSILPCFWVYQKVGETIIRESAPLLEKNPYRQWIGTYGAPAFQEDTRIAIAISDELAAATDEQTRRRMTEIFVEGTKAELAMWEEAWQAQE